MTGGRPYSLGGLEEKVAGFLMAFAPGQEGGRAIADIVSGKEAPSGRLVVSVPKSAGAMPYYYNHKLKSGGTPIAFHFGAKYPFGFGLSGTTFRYHDLQLNQQPVAIENGDIAVQIKVTNTGNQAGSEVVQVYLRDCVASLVRPMQELKAFERVELEAGQTATLKFSIPTDMLNFTSHAGKRIVEPGSVEVQVGSSSADIHATGKVILAGEVRELPRHWRMVSRCEVSQ